MSTEQELKDAKLNLVIKVYKELLKKHMKDSEAGLYKAEGSAGAFSLDVKNEIGYGPYHELSEKKIEEILSSDVKAILSKNSSKVLFTSYLDMCAVFIEDVNAISEYDLLGAEKYTDEEVEGLEVFIFYKY